MRLLRFWMILLLASPAAAQTLTLTLSNGQIQGDVTVGPKKCNDTMWVAWTTATSTLKCSDGDLRIWLTTDSSCANAPDSAKGDKELGTITDFTSVHTGQVSFVVSTLPLFTTADAGTACADSKLEQKYTVCGVFKVQTSTGLTLTCSDSSFVKASKPPILTFDGKPPSAPTISQVTSLDSSLSVSLTNVDSNNAVLMRVYAKPVSDAGNNQEIEKEGATTSSTLVVDNLINNVEYRVTAVLEDAAGNVSDPSAESFGTPVKTDGFLAIYDNAGGEEQGGGCQSVGGGALGAMTVLLGIWLARRRR